MQSERSNMTRRSFSAKFLKRCVLSAVLATVVVFGVVSLNGTSFAVPKIAGIASKPPTPVAYLHTVETETLARDFRHLIYVRNAFRVSDDRIRLTIVKSIHNKEPLSFLFGTRFGLVELTCHLPDCPDQFSPPCEINGYVGTIEGLSANDTGDHVLLRSPAGEDVFVGVIDVRPEAVAARGDRTHALGVCVQPIYLMTDYTLFVQFFEYWLAEGATKFLLYWESMSPEVREMLHFYAATAGVDIELLPWSQLPVRPQDRTSPDHNPNAFWFRLEVFMAIFDCMHRSRHSVHFVAQTDLDEVFFVQSGEPLLPFLQRKERQNPHMATLLFQSKRAHMQMPSGNSSHPSNFSFDGLQQFQVDREPFERPLYVKMIHRPERDIHVHIHRPQTPEERLPGVLYEHVEVPAGEAVIWHFRRLRDHYPMRNTVKVSLAAKAKLYQENYAHRLKMIHFERTQWNNEGDTLGRQLDTCRQQLSTKRRKVCHSLFACEVALSPETPVHWLRAENTWSVVGNP